MGGPHSLAAMCSVMVSMWRRMSGGITRALSWRKKGLRWRRHCRYVAISFLPAAELATASDRADSSSSHSRSRPLKWREIVPSTVFASSPPISSSSTAAGRVSAAAAAVAASLALPDSS